MGDRKVNDRQLLQEYVRQGSQAAFSQIVTRHLNFVYTVCRRETGDAALAEDVTQVVFLILARKAPSLRVETLSGWLFQTARFAAKNARRREASQKRQEQTMEEHLSLEEPKNEIWNQIEPHYNSALAALSAKDREAVLLRFADGLSFPELGVALGTSEDAARMRLNRAISRLRQSFARAGITVSVAVLAGVLAERTAEAAPSACAEKIAGGAAKSSIQVHSHLQGVLKAMALNKLKAAAITGLSVVFAGTFSFVTLAQTNTAPVVLPQTVPGAAPPKASDEGEINPDAAAVLRQSAQATAALHSLSADVEQNSVVEQDSVVPPRPWGLLANLTLKRPAQVLSETPGVNGQTSFVNGKGFWFYMHWNKQYQREADLDLNTSRIGPPVFSTFFFNPGFQGLSFSGLTDRPQETRTRLLGTLPWHGGTYTAVQITQPTGHGELSLVGTLTAYFGMDHLLHGFAVDVLYRGKRTVEEYALKNIRLNPDVPDAKFVFVPPAGAQPTDPPVAGLRFDK